MAVVSLFLFGLCAKNRVMSPCIAFNGYHAHSFAFMKLQDNFFRLDGWVWVGLGHADVKNMASDFRCVVFGEQE